MNLKSIFKIITSRNAFSLTAKFFRNAKAIIKNAEYKLINK